MKLKFKSIETGIKSVTGGLLWQRVLSGMRAIPGSLPGKAGAGRGHIVAVDIGATSLKVVSFEKKKGRKVLKDRFTIELENTNVRKLSKEVLKKLSGFVDRARLKGSETVVTFSSGDMFIKNIVLPDIKKDDLKKAIEIRLRKSMNVAPEEIVYDYIETEQSSSGAAGPDKHCLVLASRKGVIDELVSGLKRAGLRPKALFHSVVPYSNILQACDTENEVTGIVDIGEKSTSALFFKGKRLLVVRDLPVGGKAFTESLMEIFLPRGGTVTLSFEEAEQLKIRNGIPQENSDEMDGIIPLSQALVMLRPSLERLVGELERSLQYLESEVPGHPIGRIFLTGGGSRLKNLKTYLEKELTLPFEELDTAELCQRHGLELGAAGPEGLSSLAIAVGSLFSSGSGPNLLRPTSYSQKNGGIQRAELVKAVSVAGALLVLIAAVSHLRVVKANNELGKLEKKLVSLAPDEQKLGMMVAEKTNEAKNDVVISVLESQRKKWSVVLMDLSSRLPSQVQLTGLFTERVDPENGAQASESMPANWIRLEGSVYSGPERSEETISRIMTGFNGAPLYEKAILRKGEAVDAGRMDFVIYVKLKEIPS